MTLDKTKLEHELVAMMAELARIDPNMKLPDKQQTVAARLAAVIDGYVRAAEVVGVTVVAKEGTLAQANKGSLQ